MAHQRGRNHAAKAIHAIKGRNTHAKGMNIMTGSRAAVTRMTHIVTIQKLRPATGADKLVPQPQGSCCTVSLNPCWYPARSILLYLSCEMVRVDGSGPGEAKQDIVVVTVKYGLVSILGRYVHIKYSGPTPARCRLDRRRGQCARTQAAPPRTQRQPPCARGGALAAGHPA
jgi:hypothetical protein